MIVSVLSSGSSGNCIFVRQDDTAILIDAGLSGKKIEDCKIVLNGAGAAGIACIELLKAMGARNENCIVCDNKGVIYQGREAGMNQWKSAHAIKTDLRPLAEATVGAGVFLGGSATARRRVAR